MNSCYDCANGGFSIQVMFCGGFLLDGFLLNVTSCYVPKLMFRKRIFYLTDFLLNTTISYVRTFMYRQWIYVNCKFSFQVDMFRDLIVYMPNFLYTFSKSKSYMTYFSCLNALWLKFYIL